MTRGDHGDMSRKDVRDYSHWDDTDLQAGEDWMRGLKRFHGEPEWSDCFSTDDEESKRETDGFDSGLGNHLPNSVTPNDNDNSSDDDNPSTAEESSNGNRDTRPPTKKRKRN